MFELLTGKKPYHDIQNENVVIRKIQSNQRPTPPRDGESPLLNTYQSLIRDCWLSDPSMRPTASQVLERLETIHQSLSSAQTLVASPAPHVSVYSNDRSRKLI
jgi:serine/threonine protein kinase